MQPRIELQFLRIESTFPISYNMKIENSRRREFLKCGNIHVRENKMGTFTKIIILMKQEKTTIKQTIVL